VSDETPSASAEFAIGSRVAGYRLEEQVGRGGMAVVWRALEVDLARLVALKIIAPEFGRDEAFRQRFIRESRAAAAVDHPHIIPVFAAGESAGALFIAMRYVSGGDVGVLVRRQGPLPAGRACDIVGQVAAALDAAHSRGLVHRDVKPGNMLREAAGGGGPLDHVYLSDFGISKQSLALTSLTVTGHFLGSVDYVSPEQIQGRPVDGRADQYSLACATFEMLCGTPPFRREDSAATMWAQLSEAPPPLTARRPDLPTAVDAVMAHALAKAPRDRYPACLDFAAALRRECRVGPGEPQPGPQQELTGLPSELLETIDSPFPTVRAAAVQELKRLLHGSHPGLAHAARTALDRLAGDDSAAVAAAATEALVTRTQTRAVPRLDLSTTQVDFGLLPQHGKAPERAIRLGNVGGGNLNARAATQAGWVTLRQAGDQLVVGVDTATAGDHQGTISIDSDGGSAIIRVQAYVVAAAPSGQTAGTAPPPGTAGGRQAAGEPPGNGDHAGPAGPRGSTFPPPHASGPSERALRWQRADGQMRRLATRGIMVAALFLLFVKAVMSLLDRYSWGQSLLQHANQPAAAGKISGWHSNEIIVRANDWAGNLPWGTTDLFYVGLAIVCVIAYWFRLPGWLSLLIALVGAVYGIIGTVASIPTYIIEWPAVAGSIVLSWIVLQKARRRAMRHL
jgi:protein kinase-like protein